MTSLGVGAWTRGAWSKAKRDNRTQIAKFCRSRRRRRFDFHHRRICAAAATARRFLQLQWVIVVAARRIRIIVVAARRVTIVAAARVSVVATAWVTVVLAGTQLRRAVAVAQKRFGRRRGRIAALQRRRFVEILIRCARRCDRCVVCVIAATDCCNIIGARPNWSTNRIDSDIRRPFFADKKKNSVEKCIEQAGYKKAT
uniref:Uncharacterized protein n=1 Tax=Romanomermis culicivorax TaxID=13658 RepID=A0A915I533_ROMCU